MAKSYFDYALSQYKTQAINKICKRFQTKSGLKKSAIEVWKEYPSITDDSELMHDISLFLSRDVVNGASDVMDDSLELYNRCETTFEQMNHSWKTSGYINYDALFDCLVDLCWLLASVSFSNRNHNRDIKLLDNRDQIRDSLCLVLESIYVDAIRNHNESVYISEGIRAKNEHPFMPTLYKNQYPESEAYIRSDYTRSELLDAKREHEYQCNYFLTIYYALTATAAFSDDVWRFVHV